MMSQQSQIFRFWEKLDFQNARFEGDPEGMGDPEGIMEI